MPATPAETAILVRVEQSGTGVVDDAASVGMQNECVIGGVVDAFDDICNGVSGGET